MSATINPYRPKTSEKINTVAPHTSVVILHSNVATRLTKNCEERKVSKSG